MVSNTDQFAERKRMKETIKWMHFSDLHMNSNQHMQTEELREQLILFIKQNNLRCDYIFCTGDIRNAGKTYRGAKEYIKSLCEALEVPLEKVFIVPGNHDVNRDLRKRKKAIRKISFFNPFTGKQEGDYSSEEGIIESKLLDCIYPGLHDFRGFISELFNDCEPNRINKYENPQNPHFVIQTEDFNILHLDSTITYMKYQERHDLVLGTWYLKDALKDIDDNLPTIVLSHFPITAFSQDERKSILNLLRRRSIYLWLCGHEHDHVLLPYANIYSIQAGELRRESETNATVLFGEYRPAEGIGFIKAYTWFPEGWALYPENWNELDSQVKHKDDFSFRLNSVRQQRVFDYETKSNYENRYFTCNNPWNETFKIRIISYEQGSLKWEWINTVHIGAINKNIEIREIITTDLDDFFVGKYEINHKEHIYDDPKAYFWYYYKGTIQLIDKKIIITYVYGQRMSFMRNGSGGSDHWYTGAWANAANLCSILIREE